MNAHPSGEAMAREGKGQVATASHSQPLDWSAVCDRLIRTTWFWLTTVRPNGLPHVMPVFAAWSDPCFFVVSKSTTRKSRNLTDNPHCVVATDTGDLHVVVEGEAQRVLDQAMLVRASRAFADIYGWETRPLGSMLDADYGAPTSGGPPFNVYAIRPTKAFSFPTDGESSTPTRWRF